MAIKKLLLFQAVATFATFILIMAAPALIPQSLGIAITPQQYLLPRLIAANELAIAFMSFYGMRLTHATALGLVCKFFIVFHAATGLVCLYSLLQGASANIIGNIALRVVAVSLFYYYGLYTKQAKYFNHS